MSIIINNHHRLSRVLEGGVEGGNSREHVDNSRDSDMANDSNPYGWIHTATLSSTDDNLLRPDEGTSARLGSA